MATADSVKNKIQELINSANEITGRVDTNMTTAVEALIAGYGNGSNEGSERTSGKFYTGIYIPEERLMHNVEFPTPGGVTNFSIFLLDDPILDTGMAFGVGITAAADGCALGTGSNDNGTSITAGFALAYDDTINGTYYGVQFGSDSVTLIAPDSVEKYCRAFLAGCRYRWVAW